MHGSGLASVGVALVVVVGSGCARTVARDPEGVASAPWIGPDRRADVRLVEKFDLVKGQVEAVRYFVGSRMIERHDVVYAVEQYLDRIGAPWIGDGRRRWYPAQMSAVSLRPLILVIDETSERRGWMLRMSPDGIPGDALLWFSPSDSEDPRALSRDADDAQFIETEWGRLVHDGGAQRFVGVSE
ncbi:MAG: hypothetical protein H6811_11805 [Phycisphaeraceae bacterium]|nr:hypothetical protein [Phycisphaeraceae bacterium]